MGIVSVKFSEFIREDKVEPRDELVYHLDPHIMTFGSLLDYSPKLKQVIKEAAIEYKWSGEHFKALKELKPDVKALRDEQSLMWLLNAWNAAKTAVKPVSVLIQLISTKHDKNVFTVNDENNNFSTCAIYLAGNRYFVDTEDKNINLIQVKEPGSEFYAKQNIMSYLHITDQYDTADVADDMYAWVLYK